MKQWAKINWPVMNRRARKIEADLWRWLPQSDTLKKPDVPAARPQTDRTTAQALMVWSDDGGSAA